MSIVHDTTPSFVKRRLQQVHSSLKVILFYIVWIITLVHLGLDCGIVWPWSWGSDSCSDTDSKDKDYWSTCEFIENSC